MDYTEWKQTKFEEHFRDMSKEMLVKLNPEFGHLKPVTANPTQQEVKGWLKAQPRIQTEITQQPAPKPQAQPKIAAHREGLFRFFSSKQRPPAAPAATESQKEDHKPGTPKKG